MNQNLESTTAQNPAPSAPSSQAESLVDSLVDVGSAWARYGLSIGRLALQTSAKTLETTAKVLGDIATELERKHEAPKAPQADQPKS